MSVVILYGTETGNCELVADAISDVLAVNHDPSIYDMSEYSVEDLDPADFLIIVCSTYGEGELPSGAEPFAEELDDVEPDLTGVRFALFGLGDSVYGETFNHGGEIIAEKLAARGAVQVGVHARHDNSSAVKPAALAAEWAEGIIEFVEPVNAG
ncbi:flavodoxin domain-containing protein [Gordonia hankookensis]|uniref:Flavodoxin domain-containing protein n=1 Tax=Gordonia hankookensis TaxID=589403 RepID=A0ABR7WAP9_9ACTN|nr:flavodoxin domain-containing protein [Gordonia hankookensis]MBD1318932.1 flavodoxin domain-containing protein [Gordonia hankookensis]